MQQKIVKLCYTLKGVKQSAGGLPNFLNERGKVAISASRPDFGSSYERERDRQPRTVEVSWPQ